MSDTPMDLFVGLSAVLTGVDKSMLAPGLDPINIKKTYFDYAQNKAGATFQQLLNIYQQNQSLPAAQIGDIILNKSGDDIRYLARSVMLMWYLGSWYDPAELKKYNGPNPAYGPGACLRGHLLCRIHEWVELECGPGAPHGLQQLSVWILVQAPPSLQDFIGGGS